MIKVPNRLTFIHEVGDCPQWAQPNQVSPFKQGPRSQRKKKPGRFEAADAPLLTSKKQASTLWGVGRAARKREGISWERRAPVLQPQGTEFIRQPLSLQGNPEPLP